MVEISDKLNIKKQLILSDVLFTLHNIEEAIGFSIFNYSEIHILDFTPPDTSTMIVAICIITILAWIFILSAIKRCNDKIQLKLLATIITVFSVNAVFPHIIGGLIFRSYFPALFTSIFLYIPYSFWIFPKIYKLFEAKKVFIKTISVGLLLALILTILIQSLSNTLTNVLLKIS